MINVRLQKNYFVKVAVQEMRMFSWHKEIEWALTHKQKGFEKLQQMYEIIPLFCIETTAESKPMKL